jgi:alanine-glyoxylate transaminase/serine-glyoxylate transaminase/serine-pyruvate transaminase
VLTGVIMPEGVDADAVRKLIYERFDCSLGTAWARSRAACSASATWATATT